MNVRNLLVLFFVVILAHVARGAEPNHWSKLDKATIEGPRFDVPIGYSPDLKRFLVLGGRTHSGEYKKPRPYDVLALDRDAGQWENAYPKGKDWGPKFGPCQAPAWKDERFHFKDAEGNGRPNWTVYGTFSLGQKYDYDPDTKTFIFYAGGRTFCYDPNERTWTDLAPKNDPQKDLGGVLLWSSMCYDRHNQQFVLFGGGNVQSERGDPGTWTYTPSSNTWTQLKLDKQPPQRANARLVYDSVNKKVVLFGGDRLDQLIADTWTFDVVAQKWEDKKPMRSPSPRGGHALLWLPKAKKVLLLGGYTYASPVGYCEGLYTPLPLEAWTYDVATNKWELVKRFEMGKDAPASRHNFFLSAAVDDSDTVVALGDGTWICPVDASQANEAGAAKWGVAAGVRCQDRPLLDPLRSRAALGICLQQRPGQRRMELPRQSVDDWPYLQIHWVRSASEIADLRAARIHLLLRPKGEQVVTEYGTQSAPAELLYRHGLHDVGGGRTLGQQGWRWRRTLAARRCEPYLESTTTDGHAAGPKPRLSRDGIR